MECKVQVILIMFSAYFSLEIEYTGEKKEGFVQLGHGQKVPGTQENDPVQGMKNLVQAF